MVVLQWIAVGLPTALICAAVFGLSQHFTYPDDAALLLSDSLRLLKFSLWQALLSTLLSLLLAIPLARAFMRRPHFWGRQFLLQIAGLTFIIPTLVAVMGIAVVHGRSGWINDGLAWFGLTRVSYVYGLTGILLAHVFFNAPLAMRLIMQALDTIPGEYWRLAQQLGLSPWQAFKTIEWPVIKGQIMAVSGIVFILCFTSFAIVLTLGGGPQHATLEVAIYQALRFDYDISSAVLLSCLQMAVCFFWLLVITRGNTHAPLSLTNKEHQHEYGLSSRLSVGIDIAVLLFASVFLLSPLSAVLVSGLSSGAWAIIFSSDVLQAVSSSLLIALCTAILACSCAVVIAWRFKQLLNQGKADWVLKLESMQTLVLAIPPLTLGMGLYALLFPHIDVFYWAPALVIGLNALLVLPFILRILLPAVYSISQEIDRLAQSLGIPTLRLLQQHYWPRLRPSLALAFALAAVISMGDMGTIALFGSEQFTTLPLYMYRLLGAYRMDEAAVIACLLCLSCALLFAVCYRLILGKNHAHA